MDASTETTKTMTLKSLADQLYRQLGELPERTEAKDRKATTGKVTATEVRGSIQKIGDMWYPIGPRGLDRGQT